MTEFQLTTFSGLFICIFLYIVVRGVLRSLRKNAPVRFYEMGMSNEWDILAYLGFFGFWSIVIGWAFFILFIISYFTDWVG